MISIRRVYSIVFLCFCVGSLVACFDSCEPPFPPSSIVDKFRMLAIKAEPPEVSPGEQVTVSFVSISPDGLISNQAVFPPSQCFTQDGLADPSAIWVACLPNLNSSQENAGCTDFSFLTNGGGGGDGGTPGIPDAGGQSISILFPPCGGRAAWKAPADFLNTLPEQNKLTGAEAVLVLATTKEKQQQISIKRVRISGKPKAQQNTNPVLTGFFLNGKQVSSCRQDNVEDCTIQTFPADKPIALKVAVDPSRQDPLPATKVKPARKEDIQIRWYATAGEFSLTNTVISGQGADKNSPFPTWNPNDYKGLPLKAGITVQVIAIAKDNRGGVDWLSVRFKLAE